MLYMLLILSAFATGRSLTKTTFAQANWMRPAMLVLGFAGLGMFLPYGLNLIYLAAALFAALVLAGLLLFVNMRHPTLPAMLWYITVLGATILMAAISILSVEYEIFWNYPFLLRLGHFVIPLAVMLVCGGVWAVRLVELQERLSGLILAAIVGVMLSGALILANPMFWVKMWAVL
ncbi:MAG: hypothetical protein H0U74_06005 [Bradymonadaceae bacterium]|nr:hypothetical protein [Lujinxingiaceae bacterium]